VLSAVERTHLASEADVKGAEARSKLAMLLVFDINETVSLDGNNVCFFRLLFDLGE
jgi:hypothetical protein